MFDIFPGCIAPIAVYLLRKFGDGNGASDGLIIASDAVRYIFSFIPYYSISFSLLAMVNVQTHNNVCVNNVDSNTLTNICQRAKSGQITPELRSYIQCCSTEYVSEDLAICDKPPFSTFFGGCLEQKSFYTNDKLEGINESLLWLFGTAVLYLGILVMIEFGIISMIRSRIIRSMSSKVGKIHAYSSSPAKDSETQLDDDVIAEAKRGTLCTMLQKLSKC